MVRNAIIGLVAILAPAGAHAAASAAQDQIDDGKVLATKLCSSCHVVNGTKSGSDTAPPFATIAANRDDDFLHTLLIKPHGKMPPVDLTNKEIDAIIAYIESLKK